MPEITAAAPLQCTFSPASGSLSFPLIDPGTQTGVVNSSISAPINFSCNKNNVPFTIAANPSSPWTLSSGSPGAIPLPFNLVFTASGTTAAAGTVVALLGTSTIAQGDYLDAVPGTYTNSSSINFSFITPTGTNTASLGANSISVTINKSCKAGTAGTLSFGGAIDPAGVSDITVAASADATVLCSNNTPFIVTAASSNYGDVLPGSTCGSPNNGVTGGKAATMKDGSSNAMVYTFACSVNNNGTNAGAGAGMSPGRDVRLYIGGTLPVSSFANAVVGSGATYSDTVTLTISY